MAGNKRVQLENIVVKRMKTIMIGSIAAIEERLSHLWESDNPEDIQLRQEFEELRREILDRGNAQIRAIKTELNNFEISGKLYHYQFKVRD